MAKDDINVNNEQDADAEDTQLENEAVAYTQDELDKLIGKEKAKAKRSAIKEFKGSDEYKTLSTQEKKEVDSDITQRIEELENENKSYKAKEVLSGNISKVEALGISKRMAKMIAKDIMGDMEDGETFSDLLDDYDVEDFIKPKEDEESKPKTGQKMKATTKGLTAVEKILKEKHPDVFKD